MLYESDTGLDRLKHSLSGIRSRKRNKSGPIKLSAGLWDFIIQLAKVAEHCSMGFLD